jgi:hypothetical protein
LFRACRLRCVAVNACWACGSKGRAGRGGVAVGVVVGMALGLRTVLKKLVFGLGAYDCVGVGGGGIVRAAAGTVQQVLEV